MYLYTPSTSPSSSCEIFAYPKAYQNLKKLSFNLYKPLFVFAISFVDDSMENSRLISPSSIRFFKYTLVFEVSSTIDF